MSKKKVTQKKAAVKKEIAPPKAAASTEEKVMGFGKGTQAARMFTLLSDGKPRSVKEIHRVISETTEDHVRNGLLYLLRKRGAETKQFHIIMTQDHKLQLIRGAKPEKTAQKAKAAKPTQGKTETAEASEKREAHHE